MLGSLVSPLFRAPEGAHYGVASSVAAPAEGRARVGDFEFSELGYEGGELEGAHDDFSQEAGGQEVGGEAEEEADIGLEEFFGLMQEDEDSARERFVEATSSMSADLGVDASMLGLRLSLSHQEPEIAPHTPAVPEGNYDMVLPTLPHEAAQERSWHHDLNGSGEG